MRFYLASPKDEQVKTYKDGWTSDKVFIMHRVRILNITPWYNLDRTANIREQYIKWQLKWRNSELDIEN